MQHTYSYMPLSYLHFIWARKPSEPFFILQRQNKQNMYTRSVTIFKQYMTNGQHVFIKGYNRSHLFLLRRPRQNDPLLMRVEYTL